MKGKNRNSTEEKRQMSDKHENMVNIIENKGSAD